MHGRHARCSATSSTSLQSGPASGWHATITTSSKVGHGILGEGFEVKSFNANLAVFGKSWAMSVSIADNRLRLSPIGELSDTELSTLWYLLNRPSNREICIAQHDKLRPRADIWVSPDIEPGLSEYKKSTLCGVTSAIATFCVRRD
ncbi:hypothetical protein M758_UG231200 [Ceratodon purpureus]|nr:hypothetical protein M758_UG231200 [Ceratodon purpureus]